MSVSKVTAGRWLHGALRRDELLEVKVPLSEHEQRVLDQMEQALYEEDPKFVSHMHARHSRSMAHRRLIFGTVGVLAGLGIVLLGVTQYNVWLGALGFVVMVVGGAYAVTHGRSHGANLATVADDGSLQPAQSQGVRRAPRFERRTAHRSRDQATSGTFMQRLEQRWERRRYEDNW